jgi:hypothetical protein
MTAHRATTQGRKLQLDSETALGTAAGSPTDIEFNDGLELPHQTRQTYKPPVGGRTNPADTSQVVDFQDGSGTGTLPVMMRRGTTTLTPTIGKLLKAGGWSEAGATSLTTVAAGTVEGSLVLTADNGTEDGTALAVEQDDGTYDPILVASWTVGTTTALPLFDMIADPTDGNDVQKMFTYTPRIGPISATSAVTLKEHSRVEDGSSNPQAWTHNGVATQLGDITITPNMPLELIFNLMIAKTSLGNAAWSTETFNDRTEQTLTDTRFKLLLKQGDPSVGGLDRDTYCMLTDATISPGITMVKQTCVGGDNVNSVGGWVAQIETAPRITLTGVFDAALVADYQTSHSGGSGTNPETAIQFTWSGADINHPSALIAFPRCRLAEAPDTNVAGTDSGLVEGVLVYEATGANMDSNEGPTEPADQAMYIAISGQLT